MIALLSALAVLFLAALIGVVVYDRMVKTKKNTVMHALWRLVNVKYSTPSLNPIDKLSVIEACPSLTIEEFRIVVTNLSREGVLLETDDSIGFTAWGAQYYEFKIKPETVRG